MTTQWVPPRGAPRQSSSRVGAIVLVVIGSVLALMTLGLLAGGGFLMWVDHAQRDSSGYLTSGTRSVSSPSYAIAASNVDLDASEHGWEIGESVLGIVRITASSASSAGVFIGIAPRSDGLEYLSGVAYDELSALRFFPSAVTYTSHDGGAPALPTAQTFWDAEASGAGLQTLTWKVTSGQWMVVLMNADGSRGIVADVSAGATAPLLFAIALGLLIGGGIALVLAALLLCLGIVMLSRHHNGTTTPAGVPTPPPVALQATPLSYPLRLEGRLDEPLNRWLWLVKWVLLIPHYIVLWFLYVAMLVLTVVAFFAILFTGRYPRAIFDFNVGVLRWTWRVGFYGYSALGTDHYPPFSLSADADYPATLDVPYPEHLSRGLVLVKWWLLAIPQYVVVAVLVGGFGIAVHLWGLVAILTFFAAVALLFTNRYPRSIFDFVMGMNRWAFRVLVYVLLMRDEYPPFRFDPGGGETPPVPSAPPAPAAGTGWMPLPPVA
jgi:Domain of unknown function (DUF4389)